MTPDPTHLGLLDRRELQHFADALETAGTEFSKWLADNPEVPDESRTRMFWSFAVATAPDERCRALALACLRTVNTGAPN